MNAQQQRDRCPVCIGDTYQDGKVLYILGCSQGWDVWTKHKQIDNYTGLVGEPAHREVQHWIDA